MLTPNNGADKFLTFQWLHVFKRVKVIIGIGDGRIITQAVSPAFRWAACYLRMIAPILHNFVEFTGKAGPQSRILPTAGLMRLHSLLVLKCPATTLMVTKPIFYFSRHKFWCLRR